MTTPYSHSEAEAIEIVCRLGKQFGYGNLIYHLKSDWSLHLQQIYNITKKQADREALFIYPGCLTDERTRKHND